MEINSGSRSSLMWAEICKDTVVVTKDRPINPDGWYLKLPSTCLVTHDSVSIPAWLIQSIAEFHGKEVA